MRPRNRKPADLTPPDRRNLHEAALRHLARYATTSGGLTRVLDRRIARWSTTAGQEAAGPSGGSADTDAVAAEARRVARAVVAQLVEAGVLNDAGFAATRAQRLTRAGRSRRAVAAHLEARGVDADTAQAALAESPADELAAALVHARRRRIGPFRAAADVDAEMHRRELAMLARAGFPQDIAVKALRMPAAEALSIVASTKR